MVLLWIALIGLLVWALITYVPMPQPFQGLIVIIAILLVVWQLFGVGLSPAGMHFPR